jgi:hypothetical protein
LLLCVNKSSGYTLHKVKHLITEVSDYPQDQQCLYCFPKIEIFLVHHLHSKGQILWVCATHQGDRTSSEDAMLPSTTLGLCKYITANDIIPRRNGKPARLRTRACTGRRVGEEGVHRYISSKATCQLYSPLLQSSCIKARKSFNLKLGTTEQLKPKP